jgi:hypothetical protein
MITETTKTALHNYLDKIISIISTHSKDPSDITLYLTGESNYDDNCDYQKYEFKCKFNINHKGECKLQDSNGKIQNINNTSIWNDLLIYNSSYIEKYLCDK